MPNHVRNDLTITGPLSDRDALAALMKGEGEGDEATLFDFNRIRPMPPELRAVSTGGTHIDGEHVQEWIETKRADGTTFNAKIPEATRADWMHRHGATNWYDWALRNWGTKWNAYSVANEWTITAAAHSIHFDTAWTSPRPILEALVARFPTLKFKCDVSGEVDEEYGYTVKGRSAA
jgi:hypothetical protein